MAHVASFIDNASSGTISSDATLPAIVRQALNLVRERLQARRVRAQIRSELNAYSDRELNDMGLCRSDIEDVARNRFAR